MLILITCNLSKKYLYFYLYLYCYALKYGGRPVTKFPVCPITLYGTASSSRWCVCSHTCLLLQDHSNEINKFLEAVDGDHDGFVTLIDGQVCEEVNGYVVTKDTKGEEVGVTC